VPVRLTALFHYDLFAFSLNQLTNKPLHTLTNPSLLHNTRITKMALFDHIRDLAGKFGPKADEHTQEAPDGNEAPDWTFLEKVGKDLAKQAGITPDELWKMMLSGRLPAGRGIEGGPKIEFNQDDIPGGNNKFKRWILEHPGEFLQLIACLAAGPTALAVAPAIIGMLGFGPLGVVAGMSTFYICHTQLTKQVRLRLWSSLLSDRLPRRALSLSLQVRAWVDTVSLLSRALPPQEPWEERAVRQL